MMRSAQFLRGRASGAHPGFLQTHGRDARATWHGRSAHVGKLRYARAPADAPLGVARSGFTLLEVLVSLMIFALAAVFLGSAYMNVLISYDVVSRGVQVGEDFAFARQQVLAEPDRKKLEQGGEFDTADGRHARWSVEITSTMTADLFNVAFTCEIANPARPEPEKVVQTFMLLRPTWSIDPAERSTLKEAVKQRIYELQGKKTS